MSLRLFPKPKRNDKVYLTEDELILIVLQALAKARKLKSKVRKDNEGKDTTPKIHISIHGKGKEEGIVVHSDEDAWESGKESSLEKASAALKHSSDENAMSSRAVNIFLSQTGGSEKYKAPAGGVPLYKKNRGKHILVGSLGIAGDAPEVDEAIAVAASEGFSAPSHVRSDIVLKIPFQSGETVEEIKIIEKLPSISSISRKERSFPETKKMLAPCSPKMSPMKLKEESPVTPASGLPLVFSSESVASLPVLPVSRRSPLPKAKASPLSSLKPSTLPALSTVKASPLSSLKPSALPPSPRMSKASTLTSLKSSPRMSKASALPPSPRGSGLPSLKSSPRMSKVSTLPPSPRGSGLPSLKSSPRMSKVSTLPPSPRGSGLPSLKSSPRMTKASALPPSPRSSGLPSLKSSPRSSKPSGLPLSPFRTQKASGLPKIKSSPLSSLKPSSFSSLPPVKSSPSLQAASIETLSPKLSTLTSLKK